MKEHIQINFDFKGFHEFPIMVYSEKGLQQGKLEERKVIVLNMLNKDLSLEMISEISGLSIDEIEQIKKTSN